LSCENIEKLGKLVNSAFAKPRSKVGNVSFLGNVTGGSSAWRGALHGAQFYYFERASVSSHSFLQKQWRGMGVRRAYNAENKHYRCADDYAQSREEYIT
jgi:hypothetical protein